MASADRKRPIWLELLAAGVTAALVSACVTFYMDRVTSNRARDREALEQVVGPASMHLARTEIVHNRYGKTDVGLLRDAMILRESNAAVRSLLIGKSYLLPKELQEDARCLVAHYDAWLSEYEAKCQAEYISVGREPHISDKFDIGFLSEDLANPNCGTKFPEGADIRFEKEYNRLRNAVGIE